ncbi:hypothetical protein XENORESO_010789, partial [Xenotaenia resolanae]
HAVRLRPILNDQKTPRETHPTSQLWRLQPNPLFLLKMKLRSNLMKLTMTYWRKPQLQQRAL